MVSIDGQMKSVAHCLTLLQSIGYGYYLSNSQWSDEDMQTLRRSKAAGLSDEEIGRVLYRTADIIKRKWSEINKLSASYYFSVVLILTQYLLVSFDGNYRDNVEVIRIDAMWTEATKNWWSPIKPMTMTVT